MGFCLALCCTGLFSATLHGAQSGDLVTINFRNTDILAVLEFYSDLLQKGFVPGEEIAGEVTIISPHPVSKNEAKKLLYSVLDMRQLAVVDYGTYYKIVSKQNAAKGALQVVGRGVNNDQMVTGIIHLKYANAEDIVEDLARLVSEDGTVFAAKELNYLVVTSTSGTFEKIEKIITQIDRPDSIPISRAYKIQYMKAEELAVALTTISESSPTKYGAWGSVVPIKETNSVVITASAAQHSQIAALISQLDTKKRQISISTMFVEVVLEDDKTLGMQWLLQGSNGDKSHAIASDTGTILTSAASGALPVSRIAGTGLKFSILQQDEFEVLASALSSSADTRIISTPHILTTENQEAKLRVGNEIPVKKGTRYDSSNNEITTYEQLDFGLELTVTPIVSEDRTVTMNIVQKLSNLVSYNDTNGTYQSSEREASTSVSVKDQQTLVIGGLISNDDKLSKKGIPWLKDIPLLGYFAGSSEDDITRRELLIFITPTVITNEMDAEALNEREKGRHPMVIDRTSMEFDL